MLELSKCWLIMHTGRGGDEECPEKVFLDEAAANSFADEHNRKQRTRRPHNRTYMDIWEVELVR